MYTASLLARAVVLFLAALAVSGCSRPAAAPAPAPEKPKSETDLGRTAISATAAKSLRVRSEKLHAQPVQEQAQLTGWVMAPPGREVTLTAEVAGYVREPGEGKALPAPGLSVGAKQELFLIEPVLSPLEQIDLAARQRVVESEVIKARESVVVAEKEYQRVEGLYKQKLRAEQDLEQARARLNHAKEDLAAAEHRLGLFTGTANGRANGMVQLRPRLVAAPRAGTVLAVHVSPGQYVPLAAPLVTVADLSRLWVRVPVPENDLPRADRKQAATLLLRPTDNGADGGKDRSLPLRPVAVVPQVDTLRHTADLLYELPPEAAERGVFAKDQMVAVAIPLGGVRREKDFVIPYRAVIFDAHGGAWVYFDLTREGANEHVYERRRVELGVNVELAPGVYQDARDGVAVRIADRPGDRVVTAGAAALFSREFHKPPAASSAAAPKVDDDD